MILELVKTLGLFVATALAEIVGCYLPYLWLKKQGPAWLLFPAFLSLALFAWLLAIRACRASASGRSRSKRDTAVHQRALGLCTSIARATIALAHSGVALRSTGATMRPPIICSKSLG
jgi:hypothetical protein